MNVTVVTHSYVPGVSLLHRLPLGLKLFVLFSYIAFIFVSQSPLALLTLCFVILTALFVIRLPLRNKALIFFTILLLISALFASSKTAFGVRLIMGLGKLVCLMMVLTIFSMTSKANDILQLVKPDLTSSRLHWVSYIINMTLAVLPSIQYDLQRAIDAETLRRGRKVRFYSLSCWVTILTVVLVRSISRAERLADTVINRGYSPSRGLTSLSEPSRGWTDVIRAVVCVVPGLLIVILLL